MKFHNSTKNTVLIGLLALVVGIVILVVAEKSEGQKHILLSNMGSFIIASVVMAGMFEFWQRRGLIDDLLREAGITEQVKQAKLSGFSIAFQDNVPWGELFEESEHLDVLVSYARTWRNTHQEKLRTFLNNKSADLEIVLPNPEVETTVSALALRYNCTVTDMVGRIREAREFFEQLGREGTGRVRSYYYQHPPLFSFYRFDNRAVFATYRHGRGRGRVLTFVGNKGGELYSWISDEWHGLAGDARLVHDSRPEGGQSGR